MKKDSLIQNKIKKLSKFIAPVADIATTAGTIPEELLLEPKFPVGIFVQESLNNYFYAQDDRDILIARGLNWGIIEELPARIEYLQKCEAAWWKARFTLSPAAKEYFRVRELAQTTSDELIRAFEFLGDNDDDLKRAIDNVKKGKDKYELIFDIQALGSLCERERGKLGEIGVNPQVLIDLQYCIDKFALIYSTYEIDLSAKMAQDERNYAYTFLLVAIEELRRCARHAFWNDKKHLKGYQSEYFRRRKDKL